MPPQVLLVVRLDTGLTDNRVGLVARVGIGGNFRTGNRAHVAEYLRGGRPAVGVGALRHGRHRHARKLRGVQLDEVNHGCRRVRDDRRGLVGVELGVQHLGVDLRQPLVSQQRECPFDVGVQRRFHLRQEDLGGVDIGHQRVAVAVEDVATVGRQGTRANGVVVDGRNGRAVLQHLEHEESNNEPAEQQREEGAENKPPALRSSFDFFGRGHEVSNAYGLAFVDGTSRAAEGINRRPGSPQS